MIFRKSIKSIAENQGSANTDKFGINVSEVTIVASFIVAGLFLIGFSYLDLYLSSFGLSALEINVSYYTAAAYGFNALLKILDIISDNVVLEKLAKLGNEIVIFFILILQLLSVLIVSTARYYYSKKGLYLSVSILLLATCWGAVEVGTYYANWKVKQVVFAGSRAYGDALFAHCRLVSNNGIDANFKEAFEKKSLKEQDLNSNPIDTSFDLQAVDYREFNTDS